MGAIATRFEYIAGGLNQCGYWRDDWLVRDLDGKGNQMSFRFGKRSLQRLEGVHPDLVAVCHEAIKRTPIDFAIIEGIRSLKRQEELLAKGASTTMRSRHLTGHAIDMAPYVDGEIRWDWPLYHQIAPHFKEAADHLGIKGLEWGGDWKSFPDGPHWQLSWSDYPA